MPCMPVLLFPRLNRRSSADGLIADAGVAGPADPATPAQSQTVSFICHLNDRYNHLFHAYTTMLKSVAIIVYIVVVVVGVA